VRNLARQVMPGGFQGVAPDLISGSTAEEIVAAQEDVAKDRAGSGGSLDRRLSTAACLRAHEGLLEAGW
jgi:hypothetical protein